MKEQWTAEKIEALLALMRNLDVASLDKPLKLDKTDPDSEWSLKDCVIDYSPGPQEILEGKERNEYLLKCLDCLTPREQAIIRHRYGFVDGNFYTLEEVGKMYGITRERVRQLEHKAIAKLKNKIIKKDKHTHVYDI